MNDKLTSIVRTVVPGVWAALVAWLVTLGLPAAVTGWLSGAGEQVTQLVALAVVYAFARWVEPHLPDWATHVLLGSAQPPTYVRATPQQVAEEVARHLYRHE